MAWLYIGFILDELLDECVEVVGEIG